MEALAIQNQLIEPNQAQPSKTALYCRVASQHPNDAGVTILQLEKLRGLAKQQGYDSYTEYLDNGFSGNDFNRPAFAEMEAAINKGEIDTIIVCSLDRIVRNFILFSEWDEWRRSKGVQLIASDGSHEPPPFLKEVRGLM